MHQAADRGRSNAHASARPLRRTLYILDRWFRAWGFVTLVMLGTTALALLTDALWRRPFVLAHLAALLALLPLAFGLAARALMEGHARAGTWPGAAREVWLRHSMVVAWVVVALIAVVISLGNFQDGSRAVRTAANLTTVAIIGGLVVYYLRSVRR